MDVLLTDLTVTMSLMAELYKKLILVIEDEKQAMFSWNMDGVMLCSKNKEKLFVKLESCEKERVLRTEAIADKYNLPQNVSLSLLADKLPESYGNKLKEDGRKLLLLASNVKNTNNINANMASKTGSFLARLMRSMANELKPTNTYSRNGEVKKSGYAHVFNKSF